MRCHIGFWLVAATLIAVFGAVDSSFADTRQSIRGTRNPSPVIRRAWSKDCAPGFSVFTFRGGDYSCTKQFTISCRKKYEKLGDPYIIKTKIPPWFVYICKKTKPGNTKPTAQDCISGFTKFGEVQNAAGSAYRCYWPFKPKCRIGYKPVRLRSGSTGNKIFVGYRCRHI